MPAPVDSLYEQLFPLTTVMKQRFVENFSGDLLDTDRWGTVTQIVATCSASIDDTVNGGFKFETDSGAGSPSASMTFIDVKQFDATASTCIATCKKNDDNLGIKIGLADNTNVSPTNHSLMVEGTLESYKSLHTKNSGGFTSTATTEALSQTEFSFKIENIIASSTLYINGVSGAVSTTNLPAGNLMPYYYIQSRSTAAVKSYNSTYMECYNT
tara:strand:- start:754 stop:1392 length:639 start_codon:yes stop_codon:yes gene_type:complete